MTGPDCLKYSFLVIEGNIGTGKTSLARKLSDEMECKLILEEFEDNSFLPKFYAEPEKYAFPLEMSFLADRYQQLKVELVNRELFSQQVISDYIIDKSLIFARKTLGEDEYTLYKRLFEIIHAALPKPDLIVYLHKTIPKLMENISKRGRQYEKDITSAYLERIQDSYFAFFRAKPEIPVLIIESDTLDFVHDSGDYMYIRELLKKDFPPGLSIYSPVI